MTRTILHDHFSNERTCRVGFHRLLIMKIMKESSYFLIATVYSYSFFYLLPDSNLVKLLKDAC